MKPSRHIWTALAVVLAAGAASAQISVLQLEIDYMEDLLHSHRPSQAEVDAIVQMFACQGITLIVDVSNAVPHQAVVQCANPVLDDFFTCANFGQSFADIKAVHANHGAGWHYVLLGHLYDGGSGTGSTGVAELPGNDLFVADAGLIGTPFWRASTLVHELGHNLGLDHFNFANTGLPPGSFPANLPSVMSYRFQLTGVKTQLECQGLVGNDHRFRDLDYSAGRMQTIDEAALDEATGVGIVPVDWSCDGQLGGVFARDVDDDADWCASSTGADVLLDLDEWSVIFDWADHPGVWGDDVRLPVVACASLEELTAIDSGCPPPVLTTEPCPEGEMVYVDPSGSLFGPQHGTGSVPYVIFPWAVSFSPPGSVLFLQPGVQNMGSLSGPITIDEPLVLAGPGGAVIDPGP